MPFGKRFLIAALLIGTLLPVFINPVCGQNELEADLSAPVNYDSLLHAYLTYDSLLLAEIESDSLSIFSLLDSLLTADFYVSSLSLRFGYNSSILNAGRDYGFQQYGFSSGLSYFHKTGIFADVLGYWNSEIEPRHYLNTVSLGYLGSLSRKWSFMTSYEHFFYNQTEEFFLILMRSDNQIGKYH